MVIKLDNLVSFGKALKKIRENLILSKSEVSRLTGVNTETLRRIERGEVIPKFETLDYLTKVYKIDIAKLFVDYRIKDHSYFYELINKIENKIDRDRVSTLLAESRQLESFLKYINNSFYKTSIKQLILLINSVVLYKQKKEYERSLNTLTKAMKLTTPNFSLENYKSFVYNSLETRLLMNITFVLNRLGNTREYLEILQFCVDTMDSSDNMYPKLCHNLAGAYRRNNKFKLSLDYSNLAIESAQEQRNYDGLYILYYGKGYSEYYLDKDDYKRTFEICLTLCEAFGKLDLKETYVSNIKNVLGIEIDL